MPLPLRSMFCIPFELGLESKGLCTTSACDMNYSSLSWDLLFDSDDPGENDRFRRSRRIGPGKTLILGVGVSDPGTGEENWLCFELRQC